LEGGCKKSAGGMVADQQAAMEGDPVIRFGVDVSYQCWVEMNEADLKSFCSQSTYDSNQWAIFNSANLFGKFGRFGNANVFFQKVSLPPKFKLLGLGLSEQGK